MARARDGWRMREWTAKVRGESRNTGILGQRQVTLSWADDTVLRNDGRQWRGIGEGVFCPPPEGH